MATYKSALDQLLQVEKEGQNQIESCLNEKYFSKLNIEKSKLKKPCRMRERRSIDSRQITSDKQKMR